MNEQPDHDSSVQAAIAWRQIALCLVASLAVVGLLARLGVEAPRPLKAYGLYAAGFGFAAGWLVSKIAELTGAAPMFGTGNSHVPRSVLCIAAFAAFAGQVGTTWLTHRFYVRELTRVYSRDPGAMLAREIAKSASGSLGSESSAGRQLEAELETTRQQRREILESEARFGSFLRHRYGWLQWADPWPAVVWVLEVLAGCGVAVWTVCAGCRSIPTASGSR